MFESTSNGYITLNEIPTIPNPQDKVVTIIVGTGQIYQKITSRQKRSIPIRKLGRFLRIGNEKTLENLIAGAKHGDSAFKEVNVLDFQAEKVRSKEDVISLIASKTRDSDMVIIRAHMNPLRMGIIIDPNRNIFIEPSDLQGKVDFKDQTVILQGCLSGRDTHLTLEELSLIDPDAILPFEVAMRSGRLIEPSERLLESLMDNTEAKAVAGWETMIEIGTEEGIPIFQNLVGRGDQVPKRLRQKVRTLLRTTPTPEPSSLHPRDPSNKDRQNL